MPCSRSWPRETSDMEYLVNPPHLFRRRSSALVVTRADTWTRRLTTLICADQVRMSLVRRSLPPTKRAAKGRKEVPRIAPKVPSAHVTPQALGGLDLEAHEVPDSPGKLSGHGHGGHRGALAPPGEPLVAARGPLMGLEA